MKVVISSGHGKYIRGASGYIDEVDEARLVVEAVADALRSMSVQVTTYHDDVSDDQSENLGRICDFHNAQGSHDLDVSVHFNSTGEGLRNDPVGSEVFYTSPPGLEVADEIVDRICIASGLKNRGPKEGNLSFLNNTNETAVLVEVCFVDSKADCDIYGREFANICIAIAEGISGEDVGIPPEVIEPPEPVLPGGVPGQKPDWIGPVPEWEPYPTLGRGDKGPWVRYMQVLLGSTSVDGDFGPNTEEAVEIFQGSNGLYVDGVCGPMTWSVLQEQGLPEPPPDAFTPKQEVEIEQIAIGSEIASYDWDERGTAPTGYIKGMALAYAQVYRKWKADDSVAAEMAKANTGDGEVDVLTWYASEFKNAHMDNSKPGANTLRHLWALMLGLGMRESSGAHCMGRDMSADNTSSDTCEAGAFQTSYNAHTCSPQFDKVFNQYQDNFWSGYLSTWEEDVSCSEANWDNYGSGSGYQFQEMCKMLPAFAAETCALTLRNRCQHYGPIKRNEAELRHESDEMFKQVQDYVDRIEAVA